MHANGKPTNASDPPSLTRHNVCPRCGGLMVITHHVDLQGHADESVFMALRCANCGEFIDQVVLGNRLKPVTRSLDGPQKRKYARRVSHKKPATAR